MFDQPDLTCPSFFAQHTFGTRQLVLGFHLEVRLVIGRLRACRKPLRWPETRRSCSRCAWSGGCCSETAHVRACRTCLTYPRLVTVSAGLGPPDVRGGVTCLRAALAVNRDDVVDAMCLPSAGFQLQHVVQGLSPCRSANTRTPKYLSATKYARRRAVASSSDDKATGSSSMVIRKRLSGGRGKTRFLDDRLTSKPNLARSGGREVTSWTQIPREIRWRNRF